MICVPIINCVQSCDTAFKTLIRSRIFSKLSLAEFKHENEMHARFNEAQKQGLFL